MGTKKLMKSPQHRTFNSIIGKSSVQTNRQASITTAFKWIIYGLLGVAGERKSDNISRRDNVAAHSNLFIVFVRENDKKL